MFDLAGTKSRESSLKWSRSELPSGWFSMFSPHWKINVGDRNRNWQYDTYLGLLRVFVDSKQQKMRIILKTLSQGKPKCHFNFFSLISFQQVIKRRKLKFTGIINKNFWLKTVIVCWESVFWVSFYSRRWHNKIVATWQVKESWWKWYRKEWKQSKYHRPRSRVQFYENEGVFRRWSALWQNYLPRHVPLWSICCNSRLWSIACPVETFWSHRGTNSRRTLSQRSKLAELRAIKLLVGGLAKWVIKWTKIATNWHCYDQKVSEWRRE